MPAHQCAHAVARLRVGALGFAVDEGSHAPKIGCAEAAHQRRDHLIFALKVVVQGAPRDPRSLDDLADGGPSCFRR